MLAECNLLKFTLSNSTCKNQNYFVNLYHPSNSLIRNNHSMYLQLGQTLSVVMVVVVQGKFYVGEVVAQMLEVVVVDIVEDLLLHLISAKVVVVAEP